MTDNEKEIEELVGLFKEALNKAIEPPEFSHEQFMATDLQASTANKGTMLLIEDMEFSISHEHGESAAVLLVQRFVKQEMDAEGMSERAPQQASMLIPASRLIGVIEELIEIADHLGLGPEN